MGSRKGFLLMLMGIALFASCSLDLSGEVQQAYTDLPEKIDFNFHVKPILSDRCFACHGPDEASRQAELRLDLEEEAFTRLASGNYAFVSGKPKKSESVLRILSDDPELIMPPPESHLSLSPTEKAIIIKWIEQGADWKAHWAFSPAEKPVPPVIGKTHPPLQNAIDAFVQKGLETMGYAPSPEAKKERLLRRVTMDLTGLPPTIAELDDYIQDTSPEAYEKVVDRLLSSAANAERLAMDWMDISRYADSHGLHADGWRLMWPWRDWVIHAFKENMPYDQFVTWQLAGDLMPNATRDQKLATAFNRNHPMTAEGGAIDEEFRLNYVWDRTETVGTALMGLTVACARCHDHKFDPISQKDYFQMTAFFNNVKELGMTGDDGNYGPMLPLPDRSKRNRLDRLQDSITAITNTLQFTQKELQNLEAYMKTLPGDHIKNKLLGHYPLNNVSARPNPKGNHLIDANPKVTSRGKPRVTEGIKGKALEFTGEYDEIYLNGLPNFEWTEEFSASLWLNTTKREGQLTQTLLGTSGEKNSFWRGWEFYLDSLNHLNARLIHCLPHNYIHVRSQDSIHLNDWKHVAFTYDGSGKAKGLQLFIDGKKANSTIPYDRLYKSIKTVQSASHEVFTRPVRVAKSYRSFTGENGIFKGRLDDVRVYGRELVPSEIALLAQDEAASEIPKEKAHDYWIAQSPKVQGLQEQLKSLRKTWLMEMTPVKEVMVMEEMPKKRIAYAYDRGDYTQPMYPVAPNTPEVLPAFPDTYPKNRLGLS
ncbi:MAG: DUF1549 domain-containing protein, partial [Bacteroidota bacterium]